MRDNTHTLRQGFLWTPGLWPDCSECEPSLVSPGLPGDYPDCVGGGPDPGGDPYCVEVSLVYRLLIFLGTILMVLELSLTVSEVSLLHGLLPKTILRMLEDLCRHSQGEILLNKLNCL